MATVQQITDIKAHPNADKLVLAQILGYTAIVPKDKYKVGEKIVFIQPDNVLPISTWAEPYRKYVPNRIKAIKLRGEWSEGLIVDLAVLDNVDKCNKNITEECLTFKDWPIGEDVTDLLGISHYEMPDAADTGSCGTKMGLPHNIPKTDEERASNMNKLPVGEKVDVTLKIDGQSWSAYYHLDKDEFGVLGRRLTYSVDDKNAYTAHLPRYAIEQKLRRFCKERGVSLCLRGESYGGSIQASKHNPHSGIAHGLAIFSVYLIDERRYTSPGEEYYFVNVCKELDLPTVPVLEKEVPLTSELIKKYAVDLEKIDGKPFEGVVLKGNGFSCKVINKKYDSEKS